MPEITEAALQFVAREEGLRLKAYQDSVGVWTIGFGHTGPDVTPEKEITLRDAQLLLYSDLRRHQRYLDKMIYVELTPNQYAACLSLMFNVGPSTLSPKTNFMKLLNSDDPTKAANRFLYFNKVRKNGKLVVSKGLTLRRLREKALFLS